MPIGQVRNANVGSGGAVVYQTGGRGTWIVANTNLATAQSATELLRPGTIDDSTFHWINRGNATHCIIRARQDSSVSAVTTSPIVRLIGAYGKANDDGTMPNDGSVNFLRIDNVSTNATGIVLTLATTNLLEDGSFEYSNPASLAPYDLLGCDYIGMLVETAANITGGTAVGQILLL